MDLSLLVGAARGFADVQEAAQLGRQAQAKLAAEAKEKEEARKYEAGKTSLSNFMGVATANPASATLALQSGLFPNLDPQNQQAILIKAMDGSDFTNVQTKLLDTFQKYPQSARDWTENPNNKDALKTPFGMIASAYATTTLSEVDRAVLKDVGNDKLKAQANLKAYKEGSFMHQALSIIADHQKPYQSPLTESFFSNLEERVKQARQEDLSDKDTERYTSLLENVNGMIASIQPYADAGDMKASADLLSLQVALTTFTKDPEKGFVPILKDALDFVTKAGESAEGPAAKKRLASGILAGITVDEMEAIMIKRGRSEQEIEKATSMLVTLQGMAESVDQADKDTYTLGGQNLPSQPDTGADFLAQFERMPDQDLQTFYEGLTLSEQSTFQKDIARAMQMVYVDDTRGKTGAGGQQLEPKPAQDYAATYSTLYQNLPFFEKLLVDRYNAAPLGEGDENGMSSLPPQTSPEGSVPLPEDQVKLTPTVVAQATPELTQLAKAQGKTPAQLIGNNSNAMRLTNPNSRNPFTKFAAVNTIYNMGVFGPIYNPDNVLRSNQEYAQVAYTLGRTGIANFNDTLSVLALNMDDSLPAEYKPTGYNLGLTKDQYDNLLADLTGREFDLKELEKQRQNSLEFVSAMNNALSKVENLGAGSEFTNAFRANFSEFFLLPGNLVDAIINGGQELSDVLAGVVLDDDVRTTEGRSVAQEKQRIATRAKAFTDRFDTRRVVGIRGKQAQEQAELAALMVGIAYKYAKTLDPSGRISERDFQAALDAVSAGFFKTGQTRRAVMTQLRDSVQETGNFAGEVLQVGVRSGSIRVPKKATLQRIRALKHVSQVRNNMQGVRDLKTYLDLLDEAGDLRSLERKSQFGEFYLIANIRGVPNPDRTIKEIRRYTLDGSGDTVAMMSGMPLYVHAGTGKPLTNIEIRQAIQAGSISR